MAPSPTKATILGARIAAREANDGMTTRQHATVITFRLDTKSDSRTDCAEASQKGATRVLAQLPRYAIVLLMEHVEELVADRGEGAVFY